MDTLVRFRFRVFKTLLSTYKSKKGESDDNLYMRWEQDKDLSVLPDLGLFDEYLEMGNESHFA